DFALHSALEHRRHHPAQSFLPNAGMGDAEEDEDEDRHQSDEDDGASNHDAETAGHALERLSDREAEGELLEEPVVHRRLIAGRTRLAQQVLHRRGGLCDRVGAKNGREEIIWTNAKERCSAEFGSLIIQRSLWTLIRVV